MAMTPTPAPAMPPAADPTASSPDDTGGGETVVVTITSKPDGTFMVYSGDESGGGADMSDDDADAGASAAPQGQPADSVGAALKAAMDILQANASSAGAPGNADDQFSAGFGASKSPTPAGQKY